MVALKIEEEEGGFNQQWKRHLENFKNKQKIDVPKIVSSTTLPPISTFLSRSYLGEPSKQRLIFP